MSCVLFDIERGINGQSAEQRLRVRKEQSAPLVAGLEAWLREQRPRLSRSSSVAEPIDYMLRRWDRFARFIEDGRICLTNNAAERALRGFALGRKSWPFDSPIAGATERRFAFSAASCARKTRGAAERAKLLNNDVGESAVNRLETISPQIWPRPLSVMAGKAKRKGLHSSSNSSGPKKTGSIIWSHSSHLWPPWALGAIAAVRCSRSTRHPRWPRSPA
jgi:Transposase IS66 family